ncbi:phosphate transport system permease protein [Marmoricola endophyticus]|uniref:Phosphate transport system permease protein n=1 Tax=Marmoricola endophyticus TaxID=2040280 RepID=A0A917BIR4_9ACTN|nr:phosphate ABC transporter permease subunit PstC [Marmoricola endophyticus]GGF43940.1 phosphate transport system permease protein [Marmoricola endophyticus]
MSTTEQHTESPRSGTRRLGDSVFAGTAFGAAFLILVALAGVAIFLIVQGAPALGAGADDLNGKGSFVSYVWPFVFGTLWAAVIALVIATPLAIGVALAVSHYAPRRLAAPLGYLIDLLAAVPSVVYGLWGIGFLGPRLVPAYGWLAEHVSWLPLFAGPASGTGRTILTAGIVLAIMVLPIITAISREIFAQAPRLNQEAALALGATRWEMIRLSVLPYGRSGVVSATMLGLGRAMGETMAVAMVLSASGVITFNLISSTNPSTIAANIALSFPDATGLKVNALVATGLVLFVITFLVNFAARGIVSRADAKVGR